MITLGEGQKWEQLEKAIEELKSNVFSYINCIGWKWEISCKSKDVIYDC